MKVFHQGFARGKRGAAVGVLAASMLASALGMAPAAHALPTGWYEVGCGNELGLVTALANANDDGAPSIVNIHGNNCKFEYDQSWDMVMGSNADTGDSALWIEGLAGVTIYGHGAKVVRDDDAPAFRLLEIDDDAGPVRIDDMTFAGGSLEEFNEPIGGGVYIEEGAGPVTFNRVTVKDNEVTAFDVPLGVAVGGGIANESDGFTLYKSTLSGNEAEAAGGFLGLGVAVGGGLGNTGNGLLVRGSKISGNEVEAVGNAAAVGIGGGIGTTGEAIVRDSTIEKNSAKTFGGGLLSGALGGGIGATNDLGLDADWADPANDDVGDGSTIRKNTVKCEGDGCLAAGGGVAQVGSTGLYNSVKITENTASANDGIAAGGGLANAGAAIVINESSITKNVAKGRVQLGGGIANIPSLGGTVDLFDTVVAKNKPTNCYGLFGTCGF